MTRGALDLGAIDDCIVGDVVEPHPAHRPRWGRRVPARRCDRASRIPGSSRMIPAYPG